MVDEMDGNGGGIRKNLCYAVQKRTDEIIALHEKMSGLKTTLNTRILVFLLSSLAFIFYSGSRITEWFFSLFAAGGSPHANVLDIMLIFAAILSGIWMYLNARKYSAMKSDYDLLKKSIMKLADNEFCTCGSKCSCKDTYFKYMEKKGIDLIF